ncbi:MAG: MFS transporter [Gaiellales bacterium]
MNSQPAPQPRVPLRRNRDFLLLWVGQSVSTLGSRASALAYPLLVLAISHSPAQAGLAGFAATLPYLVLQLQAGVWLDRWNRRRAMIAVDVVRCVTLAAVTVATAADVIGVPMIIAAAFVEGCMSAMFMAGEHAAIAHVVAPAQLPEALARNEARTRGATLAGPPLGGLLFGLARAAPFAFDTATYVVSVGTLACVRREFQDERPPQAASRPGMWDETRAGLTWLWRHPLLRDSTLLVAGSNMLFQALILVIIVLAKNHGASSGQVGLVLAAGGAGGLAGAFAAPAVQRRIHPRTVVIGCNWVWAALFPLFAAGGPVTLGAVFAACAAVGPLWNVVLGAYSIALVPDHLRSRVASADLFLAFGAIPLGSLAAGLLLSALSATACVFILSAGMLGLAVAATADPAIRRAPALDPPGGEAGPEPAGSIR